MKTHLFALSLPQISISSSSLLSCFPQYIISSCEEKGKYFQEKFKSKSQFNWWFLRNQNKSTTKTLCCFQGYNLALFIARFDLVLDFESILLHLSRDWRRRWLMNQQSPFLWHADLSHAIQFPVHAVTFWLVALEWIPVETETNELSLKRWKTFKKAERAFLCLYEMMLRPCGVICTADVDEIYCPLAMHGMLH